MALITLTSDMGDQDYLIGIVKGVLYKHLPDFKQIDITHRLIPFNDTQTVYVMRSVLTHYPKGAVHLVLANFFHQPVDRFLLIQQQGQYLGIPDNGLLTMMLEGMPEEGVALRMSRAAQHPVLESVEVFAKAIAHIHAGKLLADTGDPLVSVKERKPMLPIAYPDSMEGQILCVDQFENVVVNISRHAFENQRNGRNFKIIFRRDELIDRISHSYADVPEGEKLALFNSADYLEIAVNKGNAAGLFGLHRYDEKNTSTYSQSRLIYQSVKIYFE